MMGVRWAEDKEGGRKMFRVGGMDEVKFLSHR